LGNQELHNKDIY